MHLAADAPRELAANETPTHFGRYHLLTTLGAGGMGSVHLAFDPLLERRVALKILRSPASCGPSSELATEPGTGAKAGSGPDQERLQLEARTLAKLDHPNIVDVYDVGSEHGRVYIAMEYLQGQTMRRWLDEARGWRVIVEIMLQAGRALAAAHATGLVHRDFKPDNIMIDAEGRATVVDFGIVRSIGSRDPELDNELVATHKARRSKKSASRDKLTTTGSVMGTPAYMAPEQSSGVPCDGRADEFSFCVTFFEALYGRRPFQDYGTHEGLAAHAAMQPDLPEHARFVPKWLHALLVTGLSGDPRDRHGSMERLVGAIEAQLHGAKSSRRAWAGGLALAGMLLAVTQHSELLGASDPCPRAHDQWQQVWTDEQKATIELAMTQTRVPWAADTWSRIERRIDARVNTWLDVHTRVCTETRVLNRASDRDFDERMRCLRLDRARLGAISSELAQADAEMMSRALQAAESIPDPERCLDAVELRKSRPWPQDWATLREVELLRMELATVNTAYETGRWRRAAKIGHALNHKALELGYRPLLAETNLLLSNISFDLGNADAALEHARATVLHASASGFRTPAAAATIRQIFTLSTIGKVDAADALVDEAWNRLAAAGTPYDLESLLLNNQGIIAAIRGKLATAHEHFSAAIAASRSHVGPQSSEMSGVINNLALVHKAEGNFAEALELLQESVRLDTAALGPDHPELALSKANIARTRLNLGQPRQAVVGARRALALCESAAGDRSQGCAFNRKILRSALYMLGAHREIEQLNRGRNTGKQSRYARADQWAGNARLEFARGRLKPALAQLERALAVFEPERDDEGRPQLELLDLAARIYFAHGRLDRAESLWRTTIDRYRASTRSDARNWSAAHAGLGSIALARTSIKDALDLHKTAFRTAVDYFGADNARIAEFHLGLAQALAANASGPQAMHHAKRALELHAAAVGPNHHTLTKYHAGWAGIAEQLGDETIARTHYRRAIELWDEREVEPTGKQNLVRALRKLGTRTR